MHKLTILLCVLVLSACAHVPEVDSISDAIVVAAANIESIATGVQAACLNTVSDGECAPNALMNTPTKNRLKAQLINAQGGVVTAQRLLAGGEAVKAQTTLSRAEALILILQAELQRRGQ